MVRWVVGSILHGGPIELFSFQPVLHDWYNKGHGMCYPVCGMVHIAEPLLLIGKSSLCGRIGHMVKDHSDSEKAMCCHCYMGFSLFYNSRGVLTGTRNSSLGPS